MLTVYGTAALWVCQPHAAYGGAGSCVTAGKRNSDGGFRLFSRTPECGNSPWTVLVFLDPVQLPSIAGEDEAGSRLCVTLGEHAVADQLGKD